MPWNGEKYLSRVLITFLKNFIIINQKVMFSGYLKRAPELGK